MANTFRAVYRGTEGRTYSCPVEIHDGQWMLVTTSGFAPITHSIDNEEYGVVVFDSYVEEADVRLHLPEPIGTENSFQRLQRAFRGHTASIQTQVRGPRLKRKLRLEVNQF